MLLSRWVSKSKSYHDVVHFTHENILFKSESRKIWA